MQAGTYAPHVVDQAADVAETSEPIWLTDNQTVALHATRWRHGDHSDQTFDPRKDLRLHGRHPFRCLVHVAEDFIGIDSDSIAGVLLCHRCSSSAD